MKVCFDVSTVVYLYTDSPRQGDALIAYDVAVVRGFEPFVPASALADIHYVLHRCGLSGKRLQQAMDSLFEMFDVFDVNGQDALCAQANDMRDFEDALIAESALRNGMDCVLTYNTKDFKTSSVPAMLPATFTKDFKPANIDYAEIAWPPPE